MHMKGVLTNQLSDHARLHFKDGADGRRGNSALLLRNNIIMAITAGKPTLQLSQLTRCRT
jgi:hypothetical protein